MIRRFRAFGAFTVLVVAGCAAPSSSTNGGQVSPSGERTATGGEPYHGLIQYRAKDAKEAIIEPTLLAPSEVILAAGTKVIGVFINGEARAYPLFVLSNHQIVNDVVGGTPVSASW